MTNKTSIEFKWGKNYFLHLVLINATLLLSYFLGNALLGFQEGTWFGRIIKMFLWFLGILYLSDNVWESILKVK